MNFQQHISEFSCALTSTSVEQKIAFIKKIKPSSKIPAQLAIDIYKNNTRGSRVNALKSVYPACKNILGSAIFYSIANQFADGDVVASSDLNNYGAAFDRHLQSLLSASRLAAEYSYLPELARLEFLLHAAYYADDDPVFDFDLFENSIQKGQEVYFRVSESLSLLTFQNPIHEIWMNNCKLNTLVGNNVKAITQTQYLLVYRKQNTPLIIAISYCEYQLLDAFIHALSLQSAIDSIDCDVGIILPKLIANRWITAINCDE